MKATGKSSGATASGQRSRWPIRWRSDASGVENRLMGCRNPASDARPGVASLPMYDWPEVRDATDALWAAIRAALIQEGIDAPTALERDGDPETLWTDPDLVLSQTCGFPYANGLSGKVALIATPAYRIDGATKAPISAFLLRAKPHPPRKSRPLRPCAWLSTWRTPSPALPRPSGCLPHHGFNLCPNRLRQGRTALPCRRWPPALPIGPRSMPSPGNSPSA
jgi:hypothetical protein